MSMIHTVTPVLVDKTNVGQLKPVIAAAIRAADMLGLDIETHDDDRHDGLNRAMAVNEETRKKSSQKKLIFDINRTTLVGLSVWPDGYPYSFYFNIGHADVENRVDWADVQECLDARHDNAYWIIHNAPFERVMLKQTVGYDVTRYICSMQLCVSAYGPDEYAPETFQRAAFSEYIDVLQQASRLFAAYQQGDNMTAEQADLLGKVIAKESDAAHSYNGMVKSIAWGYGLKQAVKQWFGYDMATFEATLGDQAHMGQLTGAETVAYGADDAVWCVRLYHRVLEHMQQVNPKAVMAFFQQEMPMVEWFAESWRAGWRLDLDAVERRRVEERAAFATTLRKLRTAVRELLPFDDEPHAGLSEHDAKWYEKTGPKKRKEIEAWARLPDTDDDEEEILRVGGSVAKGVAGKKVQAINLTYYMTVRTLIYDLCRQKVIRYKGKVQSDAEYRGKVLERMVKDGAPEAAQAVLHCLNEMTGIEQRSKLYIEPYLNLCDPDTGRVYPVTSSKLATRRCAMSTPNGGQLAKRGESTYVRGFFLSDNDDEELLVSEDWSSIELVAIGEASGDPEFRKAFGQLPYDDLHTGAAADALRVTIPEMSEELLKGLDKLTAEQIAGINSKILVKPNGEVMKPKDAKKFWRTEVGKGSNFNYWYSGALSTVGERLGWTPDQMWAATEAYRERFAVAEAWRTDLIEFVQRHGYVELPDGHRRVRLEATDWWMDEWNYKFMPYLQGSRGAAAFNSEVMRAIRRRAANQAVNARIQGLCAALLKRSAPAMNQHLRSTGMGRVVATIHDEVVMSIKRRHLLRALDDTRAIMCDHPDLFPTLPLHCTASVGRTFEPFDAEKAPFGQIELDEAPKLPFLPVETAGKVLSADHIEQVADYLISVQ